jgi:ketopantoate reductase
LVEAGHDVTVLARGQRLDDLRQYGIVLEDSVSGERETVAVHTAEALEPDDAYDLVLVVMRKNQAMEVLPTLAANHHTPNVLFMMNNIAGPDELVRALGKERVMMGFPLPGGERVGHVMRIVPTPGNLDWTLPIGEVDGRITERTRRVARVLESMRDYDVEIRTDMDAWLKYHFAFPGAAVMAVYATGTDLERTARTRDALVLGARSIKEAMRALRTAGIPPTPPVYRLLEWLPEPVLVLALRKFMTLEGYDASIRGHAQAARDEMQYLTDEFMALVKSAGAETPILDGLYGHFDPETPLLPDGSREISMNWRGIVIPGVGLVLAAVAALLLLRRK